MVSILDAAAYFELFLQNYPEDKRQSQVLYGLGRTYEEMGEPEAAVFYYGEFIRMADSNDPRIKSVKARLEKLEGAEK